MFAAERINKIKEILLEYRHVDVNTLCTLLSCSIATVRRDLDKLEVEGFLTKAYGGAILNEAEQHVVLSSDSDPYFGSKKNAARIAASLVEDGDIIYLGPGSTCALMASMLKHNRSLTVVTNSLDAVNELAGMSDVHVIVAGGDLDTHAKGLCTVGAQALNIISTMFIEKAFFSVDGVSLEYGYTVSNYDQMSLLRTVMHQSNESCIIADISKFGRRSLVKLADILAVKKLITNVELSDDYKEFLFKNKVKLYTSFDD